MSSRDSGTVGREMPLGAIIGGLAAVLVMLPLASKWELGVRQCAIFATAVAAAAVAVAIVVDPAPLLGALLAAALTLAVCAAAVLWRFYRDPVRAAPSEDGVVVSPADGVVIYVHRSQGGELPVSVKRDRPYSLTELVRTPLNSQDAVVVGIALNFLDVHVNRAPIAGAVTMLRRFPGAFMSLKRTEAVYANERATTVLERPGLQIAVVLIASRLVRRIVTYVREGEDVAAAQRIGAIRFGSQVDLVLPDRDDVRVLVAQGERVRAGETVVAELVR
jgi:phosphatidylserine decarboxylase